ncbi:MAG: hypothetical protein K2J88_05780, partial [Oscillospiraceae bacterium]|nr:hypothetical protein [Oscillospiraceae bacterium]
LNSFIVLILTCILVIPIDSYAILINEQATGDVNSDGMFNVVDIVMLQKWLLNVGNITCWENADFYKDDKLNIFDLCLMKQKLLEKSSENNKIEQIIVQIGNQQFTAKLYQNDTTKSLINKLPLTLDMSELNGNEKYFYFSESFPKNSEQVEKINTGDIMLYGSECLVLFYDSFSTPYSYTRIGYIENPEGLATALGDSNIEVVLKIKD